MNTLKTTLGDNKIYTYIKESDNIKDSDKLIFISSAYIKIIEKFGEAIFDAMAKLKNIDKNFEEMNNRFIGRRLEGNTTEILKEFNPKITSIKELLDENGKLEQFIEYLLLK